MKLLYLFNVLIKICFLSILTAINEENCFLNSWWHNNINLFKSFHKNHISHKISKSTTGLWFLESYFTEPFTEKRNRKIYTRIFLN